MTTELLDGYFIYQGKSDSFDLKKRYMGKRKGVAVECEKTISHHTSFEDAAERFISLFQRDNTNKEYKSLSEYITALKKANTDAVEAIQESRMERFYMYVPQGNGVKEEHSIIDLIPIGRENAITRKQLVQLCLQNNLIEKGADADRTTRRLIEKARIDYTILNLSDGHGYYRPSMDDLLDLRRYIRQEEKRAKSTFKNLAMAKRLYEDYKHGRITEDKGE